MPYAQGPDQDRLLWFSVVVGIYTIPTDPNSGSVVVQATSAAKKDQKGAAGKNKAKTTSQGKENTKVTLEWEFTSQDWPDGPHGAGVETILEYLDPNSPGGGGPYNFSHPDTDRRQLASVTVTKIDPVVWKGWHGSVKLECEEWTEPTATGNAGAGGDATKTPDASTAYPGGTPGAASTPKQSPLFLNANNPQAPNADP